MDPRYQIERHRLVEEIVTAVKFAKPASLPESVNRAVYALDACEWKEKERQDKWLKTHKFVLGHIGSKDSGYTLTKLCNECGREESVHMKGQIT